MSGNPVVAVSGSVTGGAAWFEFVGDGTLRALEGRVVIELEQIGALTIDALVAVGLHDHPLLSGRGVATAARRIDRSAFSIVDQQANERVVESTHDRTAGGGSPVIEGDAVTAHMHDDLGGE